MHRKLENIKMLILDVDGTLTDAGIYILEDGKQFKKFNARDGMGMRMAMKANIDVGIISHSLVSEMVDSRANALGLKHWYVGTKEKSEVLAEWLDDLKIDPEHIAFIGDDINDLDIMSKVGISACPSDAVPAVISVVDIVLDLKGGEGCVREFIDNYLLD